MSRISDKVLQVQELLIENPHMDLEDIAVLACVDVDFVQDVESTMLDEAYDGQPDEAQEWYDFDPDC